MLSLSVLAAMSAGMAAATAQLGSGATDGMIRLVTRFDLTALGLVIGALVFRLFSRPAEDHARGWVHMLVANGNSRQDYVLLQTAAMFATGAAAYMTAAVSFGLVGSALGAAGLARIALQTVPLGLAGLACFMLFAQVLGLLCLDGARAMVAGMLLCIAPFAMMIPYTFMTDSTPPFAVRLLLTSHIPRVRLVADAVALTHQALYIAAGLALLWAIAPRTARHA